MTVFSEEEQAALQADECRRDMAMEGQMLFKSIREKRSGDTPFFHAECSTKHSRCPKGPSCVLDSDLKDKHDIETMRVILSLAQYCSQMTPKWEF
jgi:hypothetical protein